MFTMENSLEEIFGVERIKKHIGILFHPSICDFVPKIYWSQPLEAAAREVVMPWGVPFMAEEFLEAANKTMESWDDYEFIPLWHEERAEGFLPETDKNSKESVCLIVAKTDQTEKRPAVIVCPGGGYEMVSMNEEGFKMSARMEAEGYRAFILNYRVKPNRYPCPQTDLALAVKYVKANADKYNIDLNDLMLIGSSAGGHLCASVALYAEEIEQELMRELEKENQGLAERYRGIAIKPNKLCLNYPVISFLEEVHEPSFQALTDGNESLRNKLSVEQHIDASYPQTFVWACEDDELVPVSNAKRMGDALKRAGVSCEMKIYPTGGHGCGLAAGTSAEGWMDAMLAFMQ